MRTNVYIDGYNLYYGCLEDTRYKWINLASLSERLCKVIFNDYSIGKIRYFTAKVKSPPWDGTQHKRQKYLLRALSTLPNFEIHFGYFNVTFPELYLAENFSSDRKKVRVRKPEEKGSDVNLASYLLLDAFDNAYEQALVISGDGDLAEPVRLAINRFGKSVWIWNPSSHNRLLQKIASGYIHGISERYLKRSQFPDILEDDNGTFHKPDSW